MPLPPSSDRLLIRLPLFSRGRIQNAIKEKIGQPRGDSGNDRKSQLRKELDEIRDQQSDSKLNRGKIIEELKALQEGVQKKVRHIYIFFRMPGFSWARVQIKDLNASRAKTKFKSVEEVDARIRYVLGLDPYRWPLTRFATKQS